MSLVWPECAHDKKGLGSCGVKTSWNFELKKRKMTCPCVILMKRHIDFRTQLVSTSSALVLFHLHVQSAVRIYQGCDRSEWLLCMYISLFCRWTLKPLENRHLRHRYRRIIQSQPISMRMPTRLLPPGNFVLGLRRSQSTVRSPQPSEFAKINISLTDSRFLTDQER